MGLFRQKAEEVQRIKVTFDNGVLRKEFEVENSSLDFAKLIDGALEERESLCIGDSDYIIIPYDVLSTCIVDIDEIKE